MSRYVLSLMLFLPVTLSAQWKHEIGIGYHLGTPNVNSSVILSDTLQYNFRKTGLSFVSASFMTTYPMSDTWQLRLGVTGAKTIVSVKVDDLKSRDEIYSETHSYTEVHLPIEAQYLVSKNFLLNLGFSGNARIDFFREPIEDFVRYNQPFSDPGTVDEFEEVAYHSLRTATLNYRLGTTIKFTKWLGLDFAMDRPLMNIVKSPLQHGNDSQEVNFKYSTWSLRLVYFFEWQKLKALLNS